MRLFGLTLLLVLSGCEASFYRDVVSGKKAGNHGLRSGSVVSKLVGLGSKISDGRRLDEKDGNDDDYYLDEDSLYSLSGYSMKYVKCQSIQRFSEEAVKNGEYSSMVKDDVVIMRLCPTNQCSSSSEYGCHYNYAEYAIGISDYIRTMLKYTIDKNQKMCDYCAKCTGYNGRKLEEDEGDNNQGEQNQEDNDDGNEEGNNNQGADDDEENGNGGQDDEGGQDGQADFDDDDYYNVDKDDDAAAGDDAGDDVYSQCSNYGDDCDSIYNYCQGVQDDDVGYLQYEDYFDYLNCVKVEGQDDQYYWVKPRCDGYQGTIQMDIFYDPYCSQYAGNDINLREYSGIMFRHSMFQDYYSGECIDCTEYNYGPIYGANSQMCNKVYYESAMCAANMMYHVFDNQNYYDDSTECSFIESVRFGTYNEKGELYVDSADFGETVEPQITNDQIALLCIALFFCVTLGAYSCYLHHNITNLLIQSLSHSQSHMKSPSRNRSHSRGRRSQRSSSSRRKDRLMTDDWDHTAGAPA